MPQVAQLSGTDGNVFAIIGLTNRYLKTAIREGEFTKEDFDKFNGSIHSSGSYDEALSVCMGVLEKAGYEVA